MFFLLWDSIFGLMTRKSFSVPQQKCNIRHDFNDSVKTMTETQK